MILDRLQMEGSLETALMVALFFINVILGMLYKEMIEEDAVRIDNGLGLLQHAEVLACATPISNNKVM